MNALRRLSSICFAIALAAGAAFSPSRADAQTPYNEIVVFGDSLSDNGNVFAASGGAFPPAPYFNGRFSNGPVWAELLPQLLDPSNPPVLTDFAFGGARTDASNSVSAQVPGAEGMRTTVANYLLANPSVNSSALYVVWGGANDYLNGGATSPTTAMMDGPVDNLAAMIADLAANGATTFMVANLPDLGATPAGQASGAAAGLSLLTQAHNAALAAALADLRTSLGVEIFEFDVADLIGDVLSDPASFGFSDIVAPCFNQAGPTLCPNPDAFLFWDPIHPTARAHEEIAFRALQSLPGALAAEDWALFE